MPVILRIQVLKYESQILLEFKLRVLDQLLLLFSQHILRSPSFISMLCVIVSVAWKWSSSTSAAVVFPTLGCYLVKLWAWLL